MRVYRGTSLIRNRPPPRTTRNPEPLEQAAQSPILEVVSLHTYAVSSLLVRRMLSPSILTPSPHRAQAAQEHAASLFGFTRLSLSLSLPLCLSLSLCLSVVVLFLLLYNNNDP